MARQIKNYMIKKNFHLYLKINLILICFLVICFFPLATFADDSAHADQPINPPHLEIDIPNLHLTDNIAPITEAGKNYYFIPWIAEYMKGAYRFGVGAAAILAIMMIMIGGVIWMTAGGSQEKVESGKKYIIGAIAGLILALSSYTILRIVNPALVFLNPLKVPTVKWEDLPIPKSQVYMAVGQGQAGNIDTCKGNADIYKQAATAANVPWEMVAAINFRENNCNLNPPANEPSGGPFQFDPPKAGCDKPPLEAAICAAKFLQGKVGNKLTQNITDLNLVKTALGRYNGSGADGFYVMNNFDAAHQNMKIKGTMTVPPSGNCPNGTTKVTTKEGREKCYIETTDKRSGALTIYCQLSGRCQ